MVDRRAQSIQYSAGSIQDTLVSPSSANRSSTKSLSSGERPNIDKRGAVSDTLPVFHVEDRFVTKCLSLLVDAAGITSHPSSCPHNTLAHVSAPILRDAVRSMMHYYKAENKLSKDVKYSSLLPIELRDLQVRYKPLLLTKNSEGFVAFNSEEMQVLTVKKPDRNKKELHFAMFSCLLQVDPEGICGKTLSSLARKGPGKEGCSRKPGIPCGGPANCRENPADRVCDFF